MSDHSGGRALIQSVAFEKRVETGGDGAGNFKSDFVEQFRCRAEFIHLRGGESVMASRLQGKHTQVVRVRSSGLTCQVATDWRIRDLRRNIVFNIRDAEWEVNRRFIAFTCESGVVSG